MIVFFGNDTVNPTIIESMNPFSYVIIMMICHLSYFRYSIAFIFEKDYLSSIP